MIADAFASRVCNAVTAFSWASVEPLALAYRANFSIAAAVAVWFSARRWSVSASEMSGMAWSSLTWDEYGPLGLMSVALSISV